MDSPTSNSLTISQFLLPSFFILIILIFWSKLSFLFFLAGGAMLHTIKWYHTPNLWKKNQILRDRKKYVRRKKISNRRRRIRVSEQPNITCKTSAETPTLSRPYPQNCSYIAKFEFHKTFYLGVSVAKLEYRKIRVRKTGGSTIHSSHLASLEKRSTPLKTLHVRSVTQMGTKVRVISKALSLLLHIQRMPSPSPHLI